MVEAGYVALQIQNMKLVAFFVSIRFIFKLKKNKTMKKQKKETKKQQATGFSTPGPVVIFIYGAYIALRQSSHGEEKIRC